MSQSSIIFPVYMPISMDSIIEMMNQDERNASMKNTLGAIEQFVDNNDKFIQILQLESKPEKNTLIHVAAQNGRHDIVKYLIDNAMKTEHGKQILCQQLTRVDAFDRSILHWIAQANTDAVGHCLAMILDVSSQLEIPKYINLKENVFGATPLMMAAKQGAITNVIVLLEHGADIYAKTKDNETVLDLIKYTDPKISIPTMKFFIKNTSYGYTTFIKIHGEAFKKIYDANNKIENTEIDRILSTLIAIDIDASLSHELAQLSALKLIATGILNATSMDEKKIMLANHSQVNFVKALQGYKMQNNDAKHSLINQIFDKASETSAKFNLSENPTSILAEASFLLSFQIPEAHKTALLLYTLLMVDAPSLALEGFKKINPTYLDKDHQFTLIRNTIFSIINIKLMELSNNETHLLKYLFEKSNLFSSTHEKNETRGKLKMLTDDINNTKNILDLQTVLKKISTDDIRLKIFDDLAWIEIKDMLIDKSGARLSL